MTEQEIAEIEKVGPTHPRYEEYLKWKAANSAATSGLNSPKDKPQTVGDYWGTNTAEDKIAEIENRKRMDTPIEGASGDIARGNQGDNAISNPDALNTAEVTDVHKKELAAAQTPENMNPGSFSADTSIREEAEQNKAVQSVTQPEKNDSPKVKAAKNRYNKATMSIWDAYYAGEFGEPGSAEAKRTAGYFTIDAIAKLASNLGRRVGNVGAQYSGGTIDEGHDVSDWEQRKNEILNQELTGEAESIDNYANTLKRYNLTKASTVNDLLKSVKADIEKLDDDNPAKIAYLSLAAQMANGQIDGNTTLAGVGAKAVAPVLEKIQSWFAN